MQRGILLALLASVTLTAAAKRVTVLQLERWLAVTNAAQKTDGEEARQIAAVELSERLSESTLNRLRKQTSLGPQSLLALQLVADQSAFLDPPVGELPPDPAKPALVYEKIRVAKVVGVEWNVHV